MDHTHAPLIETSIDIDAPLDHVWSIVSDPTANARLSPHVTEILVTTDGPVGVGTRTSNRNRIGELEWETRSKVVAFDPPTHFAMRTSGGLAVFSFRLEAIDADRCKVTHSRTAPDGISDDALELEAAVFGSVEAFEAQLADGMAATLASLRAHAEG